MIECDLHIHSIRSICGFHTLFEIVSVIREKGLKAFALTDHSPVHTTPRAHFSVLVKRIPPVIDGVRVFKGIEASILNEDGDLDLPVFEGFPYEIIIAGIHDYDKFMPGPDKDRNTRAVINAMKKYPEMKILPHPFYKFCPFDIDAITDVACETETAVEINNAYILTKKADTDALQYLLELALKKEAMLCVNSDGHVFSEMGVFDHALDYMKPYGLENFNIVNRTFESTLEFLGLEK